MKITKNRKKINSELDQTKNYSVIDAIKLLKSLKFTKFDESIDLAIYFRR
jgi:Ribosomal protein L1